MTEGNNNPLEQKFDVDSDPENEPNNPEAGFDLEIGAEDLENVEESIEMSPSEAMSREVDMYLGHIAKGDGSWAPTPEEIKQNTEDVETGTTTLHEKIRKYLNGMFGPALRGFMLTAALGVAASNSIETAEAYEYNAGTATAYTAGKYQGERPGNNESYAHTYVDNDERLAYMDGYSGKPFGAASGDSNTVSEQAYQAPSSQADRGNVQPQNNYRQSTPQTSRVAQPAQERYQASQEEQWTKAELRDMKAFKVGMKHGKDGFSAPYLYEGKELAAYNLGQKAGSHMEKVDARSGVKKSQTRHEENIEKIYQRGEQDQVKREVKYGADRDKTWKKETGTIYDNTVKKIGGHIDDKIGGLIDKIF